MINSITYFYDFLIISIAFSDEMLKCIECENLCEKEVKVSKNVTRGAPRAGAPPQYYFWSQSKTDLLHEHWQTMHHML